MATSEKKIKVLLAKADQDAHERGLRYIARKLRDAGVEVIFVRYRLAEEVATVALQEDVDIIGLGFYVSGLMHDTSVVIRLLQENNMTDTRVMVGGIIPEKAIPRLREMGVRKIFRPGDPIEEVINYVTKSAPKPT